MENVFPVRLGIKHADTGKVPPLEQECEQQGLSQDLDSRVSKMDFGGDRVSW